MSNELIRQNNGSKTKINPTKKSAKSLVVAEDDLDIASDENHLNDDLQEDELFNKSLGSSKIKYLPPSVLKDIEQKNIARKLAGLQPIRINIRPCLTCGAKFQSAGNRTCGCTSRSAGIIAGREII